MKRKKGMRGESSCGEKRGIEKKKTRKSMKIITVKKRKWVVEIV